MYESAWQQTPASFPEEERLLCRLYRVFSTIEAVEEALRERHPGLARDLAGAGHVLQVLAAGIETQISRPRRLRKWEDSECLAKLPPPSMPLLLHLLAISRKAAAGVMRAHDAAVRAEDRWDGEDCQCWLCFDVNVLRWFLGKLRRLLAAAISTKGGAV